MKQTTDYSLFGTIAGNRPVDPKHVRLLAEQISQNNMLHLNPIVVDQNMNVIDGQHRLEAARILGIEVYYLQDERITKQDMALLNSNKKNWTMMDYINFHVAENRPGFDTLLAFINEHPYLPLSAAIKLLNSQGTRKTNEIRAGIINVDNVEKAQRVVSIAIWMRNHFEQAFTDGCLTAIRFIQELEGYSDETFLAQLGKQPRSLVPCVNSKQYYHMFIELYNYGLSKNRISG